MKKSEALKILGLTDGASDDAIKSAHRKKVRENHPDQFAQNTAKHAEAEEKTKLINEARDVLLSRKWDPEFDPRRAGASNPYATPYGGASYGRPSQGSSSDPFADWPFGAGWVWTSWDDTRQTGTTGGGSRPGAGDPFSPFSSPFGTTFYAETTVTQTPQEMLKEATEELKTEALAVGVKVALMVLLSLTGNPATGVFIYVLGSLFMYFRRMGGCGWIFDRSPCSCCSAPGCSYSCPAPEPPSRSAWASRFCSRCTTTSRACAKPGKTISGRRRPPRKSRWLPVICPQRWRKVAGVPSMQTFKTARSHRRRTL